MNENNEDLADVRNELYMMSLETFIFAQNFKKYQQKYNKIDISFAKILQMTAEQILQFVNEAEVIESDDKYDINDILPSVTSEMLQEEHSYYCEPCDVEVKPSSKKLTGHFGTPTHLKMLQQKEETLMEKISTNKQKRPDKHERIKKVDKQAAQVNANIPKKIQEALRNEDLVKFSISLELAGERIKKSGVHIKICDLLALQLVRRFPRAKIYPFGSIVNGLGREGADLDIFVDLGECYFKKPEKRLMTNAIFQTRDILASNDKCWTGLCPITKARTPILKVFSKVFNMQCDLSFSNGLSHRNTALIGYFMDLQPVCKKIVLFVKCWVSNLDCGMNSYIITQMVIFYLQQKGFLPSVEVLQSTVPPAFIDGWNSAFNCTLPLASFKIAPIEATKFNEMLNGFFNFYGNEFEFDRHVISILAGYPIEKCVFDHDKLDKLPPVFYRFGMYMKGLYDSLEKVDEVEFLFSHNKPLVIQDPFELCHNVAKGISELKVQRLVKLMQQTCEIFTERENK